MDDSHHSCIEGTDKTGYKNNVHIFPSLSPMPLFYVLSLLINPAHPSFISLSPSLLFSLPAPTRSQVQLVSLFFPTSLSSTAHRLPFYKREGRSREGGREGGRERGREGEREGNNKEQTPRSLCLLSERDREREREWEGGSLKKREG